MRTELVFLEIASRDIEAAKLLLQNGLYPHSVFFVEQSVEKTVKSLGLWRKSITLDEAYGFGHKALGLFRKIWTKLIAFAKDTIGDAKIKLELDEWNSQADRMFGKLERWLKDEKWLGEFIEYQEKGLAVIKSLYDEVPESPSVL